MWIRWRRSLQINLHIIIVLITPALRSVLLPKTTIIWEYSDAITIENKKPGEQEGMSYTSPNGTNQKIKKITNYIDLNIKHRLNRPKTDIYQGFTALRNLILYRTFY